MRRESLKREIERKRKRVWEREKSKERDMEWLRTRLTSFFVSNKANVLDSVWVWIILSVENFLLTQNTEFFLFKSEITMLAKTQEFFYALVWQKTCIQEVWVVQIKLRQYSVKQLLVIVNC